MEALYMINWDSRKIPVEGPDVPSSHMEFRVFSPVSKTYGCRSDNSKADHLFLVFWCYEEQFMTGTEIL